MPTDSAIDRSVGPARRWVSIAGGAASGLAGVFLFDALRDHLPVWLRLVLAGAVLTFGPGAGLCFGLLAALSRQTRVVLAFSFGIALAPVLAHALGSLGLLPIYPYVSSALAGMAIADWRRAASPPKTTARSRLAVVVLVLVTSGMGVTAFANRLTTSGGTTIVYGEYDSYDLTYYAAIAAELSHTIPPASPFYSGRMLNHAFYPHVLLAMIHRFGDVPILDLYFRYAWPLFLTAAVLTCFVFVETISTTTTAFVAALLFGAGSNLAYAAGWFFTLSNWDEVVWSHNLQGAGAEVLLYGNWTPALAAMFGGLYAVHVCCARRGGAPSSAAWAVLAGATFASTVLSKPWIFASVTAAFAVVILVSHRDRFVSRRLLLTAGVSLTVALPLLYRAATLADDAQATFVPAFFPIPLKMMARIGLEDWFLGLAGRLSVTGAAQTGLAAVLAAPVFLAATLGFRLVGLSAFWQCLRHPSQHDPVWRLLAWMAVAALVAASLLVSVPYHETTQIHQLALFLLTLFAAKGLASWRNVRARLAATVVVVAVAIPSTVQYLHRKWHDREHPLAGISQPEVTLASQLAGTDPNRTVILHDRPNDPALVGILAERRSVLAWAGYVRGNEARQADVEAFFAAPDAARAVSVLRAYRPTHVIEYVGRDRMNPDVRDRLELVFRNRDVALYRVPDGLWAGQ